MKENWLKTYDKRMPMSEIASLDHYFIDPINSLVNTIVSGSAYSFFPRNVCESMWGNPSTFMRSCANRKHRFVCVQLIILFMLVGGSVKYRPEACIHLHWCAW